MQQTILVTGGVGYIGTHTVVALQEAGYRVLVLDDLSNSTASALARVAQISGQPAQLIQGDVRDADLLDQIFAGHPVDAVLHLAGVKAVGESVADPAKYYDINTMGSLTLFRAMKRAGVGAAVFSSSATVYGAPEILPLPETAALRPESPYAASKLSTEYLLAGMARAEGWRAINLRYFNPVGAHPSGLIGEDPLGIPANLFPYIAQVATGQREFLTVHGNDYPTADGTCERDYIHVVDLAAGHVAAVSHVLGGAVAGDCPAVNLGTGRGYSVLQVLAEWQRACGFDIPHQIGPRRAGDVPCYYGDPALAGRLLGWQAQYDLPQMCADHWAWQKANPQGYASH